jgi:hypothetical protein
MSRVCAPLMVMQRVPLRPLSDRVRLLSLLSL